MKKVCEPPEQFWKLLAFYLAAGALMLVSWAHYCQRGQLGYALRHASELYDWYGGMKSAVPRWYMAVGMQQ